MGEYAEIEGQCGTCAFAGEFYYPSSPGGSEDAVHCTSEAQAEMLDEQTHGNAHAMAELKEYGFLDIWRLECLAEETYRCPNWKQKA